MMNFNPAFGAFRQLPPQALGHLPNTLPGSGLFPSTLPQQPQTTPWGSFYNPQPQPQPQDQQLYGLLSSMLNLLQQMLNRLPQQQGCSCPPPPTCPPPTNPPVDPPPVDPPPVSGDFPPGSLPLNQVPVDAQSNMTGAFVNSLLTPKNAVDTNLFDNSDKSGLSKFARVGIRLLAHDLYDGQINGDVAFRTLLAPDKSGNTPFTTNQETIDMVKEWGRKDQTDDGVINGSVYGKLIEDVWPVTDGVAIPGFANNLNFTPSSRNAAEMFRQTPNVQTPEGVTQLINQSGATSQELLNFALWGHRILDRASTMQGIAQAAVNDPTSIDFGLTHFNNDTLAFAQGLITNPNAKSTVGLGVLNFLNKEIQ